MSDADFSQNRIETLRQQVSDYVDLTSANPTTQGMLFPPDILEHAAGSYWSDRRYQPHPRGLQVARQAVCAYYAQRTPALMLDSDTDVVMTASTSEAYVVLFALLTQPGDNVLVPSLSYPLFEYVAAMFQVELRPYHLDEQRGWRIDSRHMLRVADERTRAVLLVSPHNPTGMVVRRAIPALELLGVPVICDEVFAEMPYAIDTVPPFATLMPQLPIFTLNGISKMFALPDLKLGWIVLTKAASAQYGEQLEIINDTLLGANGLIQRMLPHVMHEGMAFVATQRAYVRQNVDMVCQQLRAAGYTVRAPDAGYYVCVELPAVCDEEAVVLHGLRQGVLVHPGYFFGETIKSYVVISALVRPPQLQLGIERLIEALRTFPFAEAYD